MFLYRYQDPQEVQQCLRQYTMKISFSFFSYYDGEKNLLFISKRKLTIVLYTPDGEMYYRAASTGHLYLLWVHQSQPRL